MPILYFRLQTQDTQIVITPLGRRNSAQYDICCLKYLLHLFINPYMFPYHTPLLFQKAAEVSGASLTTGPEFEALMEHRITRMMCAGSFYIFRAIVCLFATSILA
jgi:hypothetical protein